MSIHRDTEHFHKKIMDIILRFRAHREALAGDIENEAFLNVSVAEEDRDVLRYLWFDDVKKEYPEIIVLRFAQVVFRGIVKPISPKRNCETPRGRI